MGSTAMSLYVTTYAVLISLIRTFIVNSVHPFS